MAKPNHLLRMARENRHWSQQILARKLNTTRITINRWEQGKSFPSAHFRTLLCSLFDMPENELGLTGDTVYQPSHASLPLPLPRNLFFSGREQILRQLNRSFQSEKKAAFAGVQTISGLRGIGKTQIALEYAYRYRDCYTTILWLRAGTDDLLATDILETGIVSNIPGEDKQVIISTCSTWLQTHHHWLLVLDGVENIALAHDILPADFSGHVILTAQFQTTGSFARSLQVLGMPAAEGALFLLRRAKLIEHYENLSEVPPAQRNEALRLSWLLGGHPLALEQAAAFIEESGCRLADYMQYFQQHQALLLDFRRASGERRQHTVFTDISHVLERVKGMSPLAFDIVCLCAFLDPDGIPEEVLHQAFFQGDVEVQSPAMTSPFIFNDLLALLSENSLLYRDKKTYRLHTHRLVQIIVRERMGEKEQQIWVKRACIVVYRLFPLAKCYEDPALRPLCEVFLPHIIAIVEHIEMLFQEEDSASNCDAFSEFKGALTKMRKAVIVNKPMKVIGELQNSSR